jgi:hypothetical protein
MSRFFAYEEYGAKYELMLQEVASKFKTIPAWHAYEKGIECLASSLASINNRDSESRKGLTLSDLLIKVTASFKLLNYQDLILSFDSLSKEYAGILFFSQTYTKKHLLLTALSITWSLRRCYFDSEKPLEKLIEQPMIQP